MIRQVLYSWGKFYFPWGIEDVQGIIVESGMRIADPLSGNWECVEVVRGVNGGFDSAVFKYVPYEWDLPPGRGRGPTGRVLDNGKTCFNADGSLAPPAGHETVINGGNGTKYPTDLGPITFQNTGPETAPVNAAAPWLEEDDADYKVLWSGEVREKINARIGHLGDCLCKRHGSGKEVCAQIDILQKLKKELGL